MVILETNYGPIHIELDTENTPETAKNFKNYVSQGFYDETIFHRVIDGFMIQGGGFTKDMTQKSTQSPIKNEAPHGGTNRRGTIAMARTSDPHSATAQFFINVKDNSFLNFQRETSDGWGYCVFGHVVSGMEVVDRIKEVKTTSVNGHGDVPVEPVIIEKAYCTETEEE